MAREAADVLERAARLLEERGWCRGAEAKDKSGAEVGPLSPGACRWSATGAIRRVEPNIVLRARAVRALTHDEIVAVWNDRASTKRTVIRAMRRTAKRLRSQGERSKVTRKVDSHTTCVD